MKKNALALLLTLAPAAFAGDVTGRFDAGTKYEEPAAHAPANISRMFARSIPRTAANAKVEIPAAGDSGMIIWTIPAHRGNGTSSVAARLVTPTGAVLQPNERGSVERGLRRFQLDPAETSELGVTAPGAQEVLHVMRTAAASYQLELDLPQDIDGVTVIAAEPDSPVTFATWAAPLSRQPGEPVTLHAELRDGDTAIEGATVTARLASPNGKAFASVPLAEVAPGVYSATVADLPEQTAGAWQIRFEADGKSAKGARFLRTGSGELVAERGSARLGKVTTEVIGDVLRVSLPADVAIAGTYRFDVILADGARNGVAWGEAVRTLDRGATSLSLEIPLSHLGTTRPEDLFLDARLLGLDPMGVAGRVTLELN
ncbi:MAG TPA: hypothetical protein VEK57_11120 [Thermoanaerobaculia bacterium]|nr:hypothetical protein [Thermoanaerobaculia bacterium]